MFKILKEIVPNPGIEFKTNERTGVWAIVPKLKKNQPTYIKKMKQNSFNFIATKLFNRLPKYLRSFEPSPDVNNITFAFKSQLDKFLEKIPDQPTVYGDRNMIRAANSNSLNEQVNYIQEL